MQQRELGCGERPARGPIPRYARIWRAEAVRAATRARRRLRLEKRE